MKNYIKSVIARFGLRTDRKMVIITSDDWGSLRMRSQEDREALAKVGVDVNTNRFDRFDSLETNEDLEELFEVLLKHKDHLGHHPIITAVTNVANPDFTKIRKNEFSHYYLEDFTQSLKRYPNRDKVVGYYQKGIEQKIFIPESHGREHLQVHWWMRELKDKKSYARRAFDKEFFFLGPQYANIHPGKGLGAAFDVCYNGDMENHLETVKSSLELFENLFGYKAFYFTPPAIHHHNSIEEALVRNGVEWLDVPRWQKMPIQGGGIKHRFHYLGRESSSGLRYLIRNAVFESNLRSGDNGVNGCMANIAEAFKNKQPAIISNHRASFAGAIDPRNREKGLYALDELLTKILQQWPDVEFTTLRNSNL